MEDEDVDCVKTNVTSISDNLSSDISVSKEINNKVISNENYVCSSIKKEEKEEEESCGLVTLTKLKSLTNHEKYDFDNSNKIEETNRHSCVESSDSFDCNNSNCINSKKVNGEIIKSGSCVSEEEFSGGVSEEGIENIKDISTIDNVEVGNKKKRPLSNSSDDSNQSGDECDKNSSSSSPTEFRGFKKQKTTDTEILLPLEKETHFECNINCMNEIVEKPKVELRRSARNASIAKRKMIETPVETKEESEDQLTEYAQYLGLQPTVKFKCGRCGEKHFQSMASLNAHQSACCNKSSSNALVKPSKPTGDPNLSTNFRITRKVYLCSACGTYYENWKLFLHMRDMHKRHICLFCLGMFSVADKLAEHLLFKHNVHEKTCKSPEEFLNLFKGSCYLTCCSCEKMFTEREDFFDHHCKEVTSPSSVGGKDCAVSLIKDSGQRCNICGVKCGHFQSCPNVSASKVQNASSSSPNNKNSNSNQSISLTKYYIPVPASVQKGWSNKVNTSINADTTPQEKGDYYDVGNAASFCHVDIANDGSDIHSSSEKKNSDLKTYSRVDNRQKNLSKLSDDKENTTDLGKNTTVVSKSPINSNDSDNSHIKKNEKALERTESFDNENSKNQNNENEDKNGADDEKNASDSSIKQQNNDKAINDSDNICLEEKSVDTKNDDVFKPTDNSDDFSTCFVKLDRLNDKSLKNDSTDSLSTIDNVEMISKEVVNESNCINISNDTDELNENSIECKSIAVSNSPNSRSSSDNDQEFVELDEMENKNKREDLNSDTEKILNDDSLSNKISPQLSEENSFEDKHGKKLVDKSDESDDSDKLSVVLSDEDDNVNNAVDEESFENKTEDVSDLNNEQQTGMSETNRSLEDNNKTADNESLKRTDYCDNDNYRNGADDGDDDNDSDEKSGENTLQNGDETTDDSTIESQPKSKVYCNKEGVIKSDSDKVPLANEEVIAMALTLEDRMDNLSSQFVIKECVRTSCTTCSYCSHAIKIAVNGKQLALHLLAEHRYMPVKNETVEDVIERLKKSLDELQDVWFNTDSYDSSDKSCFVPYDHTYECFQCNFVTNLHKDLYNHKRKVHQKTILYCSMCKANFYSYSELLCHMCPGVYVSKDIQFRCCFCELDRIQSAFRLMVHLRKSHHSCDMCLEMAGDQQKLSTHMWKHKLHHLCYRCGIAYRNKPDITKHLFWKHGTESVLCKKCLQKKWPHVYHFCIPPTVFICEECNFSFSKAVALKVHKRMHSGDCPYSCTKCDHKFISKKLLIKHEKTHNEIPVEDKSKIDVSSVSNDQKNDSENQMSVTEPLVNVPQESTTSVQEFDKSKDSALKPHKKKSKKDRERKIKQVVDVYDLPPLNLSSESDDSDDDKEVKTSSLQSSSKDNHPLKNDHVICEKSENKDEDQVKLINKLDSDEKEEKDINAKNETSIESGGDLEETPQPVTVVDGIWDNFHSYKAEQEKRENLDIIKQSGVTSTFIAPKDSVLGDHDYCFQNVGTEHLGDENIDVDKSTNHEHSSSIDHDYCSLNNSEGNCSLQVLNQDKAIPDTPSKKKQKSPKKKVLKQHNSSSSSDSSSDSDSSSCSCGTNCSCTSSSSNSSSSSSSDSDSSSSEGRHHNSSKREKKKEKLKNKRKDYNVKTTELLPAPEEEPPIDHPVEPDEPLIKESDLETDETSTDEEFYDQYPQRHANQLLAEKRNQLMVLAAVAPVNNVTASSSIASNNCPPPVNNTPVEITPPVTSVLPSISTANSSVTATSLQNKRRVKSKKRKKSSQPDNSSNSSVVRTQNILYESSQPSTSFSTLRGKQNVVDTTYSTTSSSLMTTPLPNQSLINNNTFLTNKTQQPTSESHSKRLSKRRRVRNKFYGYSSEEEDDHAVQHHPPPSKWKKTDVNSQQHSHVLLQQQQQQQIQQQTLQVPHHLPPVLPSEYNFQPKIPQQPVRGIEDNRITINVNEGLNKRVTSSDSNSSEVDSESDTDRPTVNPVITNTTGIASEKDDKLYCYCQCPYDEVSEMIACDGVDCTIEWFHFECVGIMVPPKGKWYCPDCRKRRGLS